MCSFDKIIIYSMRQRTIPIVHKKIRTHCHLLSMMTNISPHRSAATLSPHICTTKCSYIDIKLHTYTNIPNENENKVHFVSWGKSLQKDCSEMKLIIFSLFQYFSVRLNTCPGKGIEKNWKQFSIVIYPLLHLQIDLVGRYCYSVKTITTIQKLAREIKINFPIESPKLRFLIWFSTQSRCGPKTLHFNSPSHHWTHFIVQ